MANARDLDDTSLLWREYKKTSDLEIRNKLVARYLILVKRNAEGLKKKLPVSIELDDLISAGTFGLMNAIENFDLSRGVYFETYCVPRIRGAMFDELRQMDWVPRYVRLRMNKYKSAMEVLSDGNGHAPTLQEIADCLRVSIEDAKRIEVQANTPVVYFYQIISVPREEIEEDHFKGKSFVDSNQLVDLKAPKPEDRLLKDEGFWELISCLSDQEQIIVTLYHKNNYEMRKIGEVLSLSESRVRQIHFRALLKIKDSLMLTDAPVNLQIKNPIRRRAEKMGFKIDDHRKKPRDDYRNLCSLVGRIRRELEIFDEMSQSFFNEMFQFRDKEDHIKIVANVQESFERIKSLLITVKRAEKIK